MGSLVPQFSLRCEVKLNGIAVIPRLRRGLNLNRWNSLEATDTLQLLFQDTSLGLKLMLVFDLLVVTSPTM